MTPETPAGAGRRLRLGDMPWQATLPAAAALFLGLGALWSVRDIARPLGFLVVAIAIAEALAPLVAALERRGVPRGVAIVLVFLGLIVALTGVGWLLVPTIMAQASELVRRLPEFRAIAQRLAQAGHAAIGAQLDALLGNLARQVGGLLLPLPLQAFAALINLILLGFLSAYWLMGAPALARFALTLLPDARHAAATDLFRAMGQAMGGYVRGTAINSALIGVMVGVGLALAGVRYPVILGTVTMLLEPLPVIGPWIAAGPVVLVALLDSPSKALLALGVYVVLTQVGGQVLTPIIMRRATDIPQTLVIFAILAGAAVGGLLGLVVSIPLVAALRVFVLRVVVPVVRRWTGAEPGAPPVGPARVGPPPA